MFLSFAWVLLVAGVILTSVSVLELRQIQQTTLQNSPAVLGSVHISAPNTQTTEDNSDLDTIVETADARTEIVANFLERHNSPLEPYSYYGTFLVEIADKYGIDFRLVPVIAMQESNLCKVIPKDSNNCLGFGVHSRGTLTFDRYEDGFERAARELKSNYIDRGLTTPEAIMKKYTPHSNGSWAASVNQWMAEMRYDDRQLGRTLKSDADLLEFIDATSAAESDI
ncbi:glucosaminidase domain-containing protein [Candidatus Woesebacteria bacterium]|nr:glucosaminidase domain-containing protein [Candidatus Woesebacteria bacterium]